MATNKHQSLKTVTKVYNENSIIVNANTVVKTQTCILSDHYSIPRGYPTEPHLPPQISIS